MDVVDKRPNPDALLQELQEQETCKGKLKIFFGYAAGVGKTYAMLNDAHEQQEKSVDVLVGYVEPHDRPETMQLMHGLPILNPKIIPYKNIKMKEFDLDAALERKPDLILVDELAHTNTLGQRNKKRYQDIEELLNAGIDVYTTINVQHIESLNDIVQDITKIKVQETIPDYIFDYASAVKLIDLDPEELLKRLEDGKIYQKERAEKAMSHFFTAENLRKLREIAIRKLADRISQENWSKTPISKKGTNVKLLVCISPSPSSAKLIRWTARTAEAFHAPWVAVYVQRIDGHLLSDEEKKTLGENVSLAEKLGAEIITLNGYDNASVVAEYAKISGITNIVVGKSRNKKSLKSLFDLDFEDKLIELLPNIEVHIIPSKVTNSHYRHVRMMRWRESLSISWSDTLKAILLLLMATLISFGIKELNIGDQNVIMVYILSVLFISRFTVGYAFGIVGSIMSVLLFNFFFTVPYYTFNVIEHGYPITVVIMLVVALITSALTVRIKTQARVAVERERRTEVLYNINKKILATRGLHNIIFITTEYIANLFNRSVIFYTEDPVNGSNGVIKQVAEDGDAGFLNSDDERAVVHWVFTNQKRAGAGTDTLMGAEAFYIPIVSQGKVLGVLGLSCKKKPMDYNQTVFISIIVSQVAMALERQYLSDEQQRILVSSEKEKMRSNLLRAISHDLRTPLTGILGASSAILDNDTTLDRKTCHQLVAHIKEDSQWLIRMVENLLSVTRINEGTMHVAKIPEAVEEVIAESINRIKKRFPNRRISAQVPEEVLLVPMDGILIIQVLINLLENAIKHSNTKSVIEVKVKKTEKWAVFEVIDSGAGIRQDELPYIFEGYISNTKKSADSSRGMGIGLSICLSIIKAHNGKMEAANRNTGGAIFRFSLPIKEGKIDG